MQSMGGGDEESGGLEPRRPGWEQLSPDEVHRQSLSAFRFCIFRTSGAIADEAAPAVTNVQSTFNTMTGSWAWCMLLKMI